MKIRGLPLLRRVRRDYFSSSPAQPTAGKIFEIGTVLRLSQRFSQADVLAYSKLTGDANPVHLDPEFASGAAGFLGPIVHGLLVASLFPRIIAGHFPGAVYVSQGLNFKLPVYIGEEIVAEVQAAAIRENKARFIAKFSTKCFRGGVGPLVIDGEATAILPTLTLRT